MSKLFDDVRPGELIKANFINQLLKTMGTLDDRIAALEAGSVISGGPIVISGISPAGPLHMGDELRVLGQNFGLPAQVVVTIDSARVDGSSFKAGSGDGILIFDIPAIQGVPAQGKLVTLTVANSKGQASITFTVFPFQVSIPTGQLFVNLSAPPAVGTITPNNTFNFTFTINGFTSLGDTYTLTPAVVAQQNQAGWQAVVVDSNGNPLSPPEIVIPEGQNTKTNVIVKVTVPGGTNNSSAQLSLTAKSKLNPTGVSGSGVTTITVGAPPPAPPKITLSISAVSPPGTFALNVISIPTGTNAAVVIFTALIPDVGSYKVPDPTFDNNSWAGTVSGAKKQFTTGSINQTVQIPVQIVPQPGAAPANMVLKVTDANANVLGQIAAQVKLV